MSTAAQPRTHGPRTANSNYFVVSAGALVVLLLALAQLDLDIGMLPLLLPAMLLCAVALLGLALRWRLGPIFLLVGLAVLLLNAFYISTASVDRRLASWLLSAAVLCYAVGHYRLLGLRDWIMPPDPRVRSGPARWQWGWFGLRKRPPVVRPQRSAESVQPGEIGWLVVGLPVWVVLAQILWDELRWNNLHWPWQNPGLAEPVWQLILLIWSVGFAVILVHAAVGYWRRRTMTVEEAELLLQDVVWRQTRREQGFINRALVRDEIRRQRKEGDA